MIPATWGAAMLVPDIVVRIATVFPDESCRPPHEAAATMSVPGAAISGLCRPSRVVPRPLESLGTLFRWS